MIISINILLTLLFISGIVRAGGMVLDEIQTGNGECPKTSDGMLMC